MHSVITKDVHKLFWVVGTALLVLCLGSGHAEADEQRAIDVVRSVQLDGISLQSTAHEIEDYITSHPSMDCQHTDVAARKSPFPNKPSIDRKRAWLCKTDNPAVPVGFEVQMIGNDIKVLRHGLRYDNAADYVAVAQEINKQNKLLRAAGLKDKALNPDSYVSYDVQNAIEAMSTQKLIAEVLAQCSGQSLKLSMGSYKMPASNTYGAYIEIENNKLSKRCKG